MSRDGIDGDDMDLVEVCDQALEAACSGLMQTAEHAAPELRQYRNVYDGNGEYEYELPMARHYVPQYWRS